MNKAIHIFGGGTVNYVRSHLAIQVPVIIDDRVSYWSVTKTFYEKLVTQVQTQVLLDNQ